MLDSLHVAFRFLLRIVRGTPRYLRLILTIIIAAATTFFGFHLRPQNYPIPASTDTWPYLDVLATVPNVNVQVTYASISPMSLIGSMTVLVPAGSSPVTLYVELSGVRPDWYYGEPSITPNGWSTASDYIDGEYSIGHSYALKAGSGYSIPLDFGFEDCACYKISGPYIAVSPLHVDPLLTGPDKVSSDGVTITKVRQTLGPTPGMKQGKYYETTLTSIGRDEAYLDTPNISPNLTVMSAIPEDPTSTTPSMWEWNNVSYASATFVDPGKQDSISYSIFYGGIFLGIAGAAVLALIPEASSVIEKAAERRRKRKEFAAKTASNSATKTTMADRDSSNAPISAPEPVVLSPRTNGSLWAFVGTVGGALIGWALGRKLRERR